MPNKTVHEPDAELMSANDVRNDAQRLAEIVQRNARNQPRSFQLQIPLSAYLSALDDLNQEELEILRERVDQRLAS